MRSEVNCHPLVRSDTCIRTLIARHGNNVQQSLVLLSCKAGAFMGTVLTTMMSDDAGKVTILVRFVHLWIG